MVDKPSRVNPKSESMIERGKRAIKAPYPETTRFLAHYGPDDDEPIDLTEAVRAVITTIRDALPQGISRTILDKALEDD